MLKTYTCIVCPNGCEIEAAVEDGHVISAEGALCNKGRAYVEQEAANPQRNIATSVLVKDGELPLVSVRLTNPIPKSKIFDAMQIIKGIELSAPVKEGTVLVPNILGFESDVITTKKVGKREINY